MEIMYVITMGRIRWKESMNKINNYYFKTNYYVKKKFFNLY